MAVASSQAKPSSVIAPLFVPALDERKLVKATDVAEAVIVDLEDAVADSRKVEARHWLSGLSSEGRAKRWIRVNSVETGTCREDVLAAAPQAAVIVLPKCQSADDVRLAVEAIERTGSNTLLIPLIETALGVEAVLDIAKTAPGRIVRLAFGLGDFSRDMGVAWEPGGVLSDHARCRVAVASRAAGLAKPIDSVVPRVDDIQLLRDDAARGRAAGFGGKFCIHPTQLAEVIASFRATAEELALERRKVEAFAHAIARGGATAVVDGYFIDYPVAELAEARLEAEGQATGLLLARPRADTLQN